MVDNTSFSDRLASVSTPAADVDHGRALQALQSEIEFHRARVGNGTYLDKAVSYVYDGGQSASQEKLELAYKNEKDNPNSLSREQVTKLVKEDQSTLQTGYTVDAAVGVAGAGLAYLGGARGRMAASALIVLNSVHPNDSVSKQGLELIAGAGIGMFASQVFAKGAAMPESLKSTFLQAAAYPGASYLTRDQWPNQGSGQRPDVEKIYNAPVPKTTYAPYSNLVPVANSEWKQFDFLNR